MAYNPAKHRRRSIRLRDYDYSQPGAYFITVCTYDRDCLFGEVVDGVMELTPYGRMVADEWHRTEMVRPNVVLDAFVVMPNHVHGIIGIVEYNDDHGDVSHRGDVPHRGDVSQRRRGVSQYAPTPGPTPTPTPTTGPSGLQSPSQTVGAIVRGFKGAVTKRINHHRGTPGVPVWQRGYYEHIIRNERALNRIRRYIIENPLHWHKDRNRSG